MPPIWNPRVESDCPRVPVVSLLLDGPFTDYHVSSLMLAAYMGHIQASHSKEILCFRPAVKVSRT
jgi:hypothetical protein